MGRLTQLYDFMSQRYAVRNEYDQHNYTHMTITKGLAKKRKMFNGFYRKSKLQQLTINFDTNLPNSPF